MFLVPSSPAEMCFCSSSRLQGDDALSFRTLHTWMQGSRNALVLGMSALFLRVEHECINSRMGPSQRSASLLSGPTREATGSHDVQPCLEWRSPFHAVHDGGVPDHLRSVSPYSRSGCPYYPLSSVSCSNSFRSVSADVSFVCR